MRDGHSYEAAGSHTYESPDIPYDFETSHLRLISQIMQQYPWVTQWQQKLGLIDDGTLGLNQSSQDTFEGNNGNGKENRTQETADKNPLTQALNLTADNDHNNNSQASITVSKPSPDETYDSTEPFPYPFDTSNDDYSPPPPFPDGDDDDWYSGESSSGVLPKYFDIPPKYIAETRDPKHGQASPEKKEDIKSVVTTEGKKNTTTRRPPPMSSTTPSGPEPGTMSRPVPKLGLLFAPSLQWHVGIYSKTFTPYMQVCGGSLVKADVVLSAAHCFWDDAVGALRPGLFAVAAGKLLRPWETEGEIYTQHSDVKDIKIPPRFRGSKTSFQDDLAIVILTRSLEYAPGVKPVCISFDLELEGRHLTSGNLGKIAGWGLTEINGPPSQRLNFLELPYVDIEECLRTAEDSFLKYITSDKICAGDQKTGRALCRGDSGGGLIYYSSSIPYLHGIASTAPRDNNKCNAYAVASFTHVQAHRRFLISHVPDIGEGCEELYVNKTGVEEKETELKPENVNLTPSASKAQEEDRISTDLALESGMPNIWGPQISLTAPTENDKNEEANTVEPISLTVPSENDKKEGSSTGEMISNPTVTGQNDKNEEANIGNQIYLIIPKEIGDSITRETISNATVTSQDFNNEELNTEAPIFLAVSDQNDKKGMSNIGEQMSNPTVYNQNDRIGMPNTEEQISLTVLSENDKNGMSNTGETISNRTVTSQDENNEELNTREPISLPVPSENDKNGMSNTGETISNPTVTSQNENNEELNTREPISLTVPSENNKNKVLNKGETISNPTKSSQDADSEELKSREPISLTVLDLNDKNRMSKIEDQISLTVPSENDNNGESNTGETISNVTVTSQNVNNRGSNMEEPISSTVPDQTDEKEVSNTGEQVSNQTVTNQNDINRMSSTGEPIYLTVPNQNDYNTETNTEIQISTNRRPIWETNGKEEIIMNAGSGGRGVARISVDDSTNTLVNKKNYKIESNTEIQISNLTESQTDHSPIWETNGKEKEIVMKVESGERGVARISVDNSTSTLVNKKDYKIESNTEIQISNLTEDQTSSRPIWETNRKEKEIVIKVESGERGVARISVDDNTRTLVCNCYCNT